MAKKRIDLDQLDAAADEAALKAAGVEAEIAKKNIMVKGVPVSWFDTLKDNGHAFGSYARIAVQEKMKRDGLL
jgi:hypothetical protein